MLFKALTKPRPKDYQCRWQVCEALCDNRITADKIRFGSAVRLARERRQSVIRSGITSRLTADFIWMRCCLSPFEPTQNFWLFWEMLLRDKRASGVGWNQLRNNHQEQPQETHTLSKKNLHFKYPSHFRRTILFTLWEPLWWWLCFRPSESQRIQMLKACQNIRRRPLFLSLLYLFMMAWLGAVKTSNFQVTTVPVFGYPF